MRCRVAAYRLGDGRAKLLMFQSTKFYFTPAIYVYMSKIMGMAVVERSRRTGKMLCQREDPSEVEEHLLRTIIEKKLLIRSSYKKLLKKKLRRTAQKMNLNETSTLHQNLLVSLSIQFMACYEPQQGLLVFILFRTKLNIPVITKAPQKMTVLYYFLRKIRGRSSYYDVNKWRNKAYSWKPHFMKILKQLFFS